MHFVACFSPAQLDNKNPRRRFQNSYQNRCWLEFNKRFISFNQTITPRNRIEILPSHPQSCSRRELSRYQKRRDQLKRSQFWIRVPADGRQWAAKTNGVRWTPAMCICWCMRVRLCMCASVCKCVCVCKYILLALTCHNTQASRKELWKGFYVSMRKVKLPKLVKYWKLEKNVDVLTHTHTQTYRQTLDRQ